MKKKVIIIGGGFGGLKAAITLSRYPDLVDVTLIDRRNYHLFQPLLYQVATAGLSPADIATPIRQVLSEATNIRVLMDEIKTIDLNAKNISSATLNWKYDYLLLACGAGHSYFGHDEWEDFAPGLKTLEMATEIRRRILTAFESAEKETDIEKIKNLLTFVVIGGGPTGVEMAGAIAEISKKTMERDFKNVSPDLARIILVEAGPKVLSSFHEDLSLKTIEDLIELGVEVKINCRVTSINKEFVLIESNGMNEKIPSGTVIWAAGVKPSLLNKQLNEELDRSGRVKVTSFLNLKNYPEVFVIGDQAHFQTETSKVLPGLAPVAIQMGIHSAKNIIRLIEGNSVVAFSYTDKGQMATIGRKKAVMEFKKIRASGMFAWLAWLFVHIYYLITFKNRLFVMIQWIWSYFTFARGARLITKRDWKEDES
jgi:NADH dehydrogenase